MNIKYLLITIVVFSMNTYGSFLEIQTEVNKWVGSESKQLKANPLSFIKIEENLKTKRNDFEKFKSMMKKDINLCTEKSLNLLNNKLITASEYLPLGEINYICYESDNPGIGFYNQSLLVISSKSLELLTDLEFIGLTGHELAHSYFVEDYEKATLKKEKETLHSIELKCDIITLALMNYNKIPSESFFSGLKKHTALLDKISNNEDFTSERVSYLKDFSLTFFSVVG